MTALVAYRIALDDHEAAAVGATAEPQLVSTGKSHRKKDRVLERDLRGRNQRPIDLERLAQQLASRHAGQPLTRLRRRTYRHDAEQGQQAREHRRLLLHAQRAGEIGDLLRRLAAVTRHVARRIAHVGAVQLANAVVAEPGPRANGLRARLVAQKAQSKLEAQPLAAVAIVRDAHGAVPGVGAVRNIMGENHQKDTSINLVKNYQIDARSATAVRYHRAVEQE